MTRPLFGASTGEVGRWLRSAVDPITFAWFRRMFLGKLVLFDVLALMRRGPANKEALLETGIAAVCLAFSETRRGLHVSAAILLLLKVTEIVGSFPFTINHAFFDAALLLVLACGYDERDGRGLHPVRVAQAGILIVFFHAGLQKVVHGYYTDGQWLTLRTLYHDGDMGGRLRRLLRAVGQQAGLPLPLAGAAPRSSGLAEAPVNLPLWAWGALRRTSNVVWMAEAGLPLLALHPVLRSAAVLGLLILEVGIVGLTGEISFGFTVIACLLVFFPRVTRWASPVAMVLLAIVAAQWKR